VFVMYGDSYGKLLEISAVAIFQVRSPPSVVVSKNIGSFVDSYVERGGLQQEPHNKSQYSLNRGLHHEQKGCTIPLQSAKHRPTTYTKRSLNSVNKAPGIHNTHMKRAIQPMNRVINIHEKNPTFC